MIDALAAFVCVSYVYVSALWASNECCNAALGCAHPATHAPCQSPRPTLIVAKVVSAGTTVLMDLGVHIES